MLTDMHRHRVFVDGYKSMRAIAKGAAKKAGKKLFIFKDGKTALEGIRKMDGMVDVVTGLIVPGMNGIALARCLKDRPKTDIFMCSAVPDSMENKLDETAERAGIVEVLVRERMLEALAEIGIECEAFKIAVHNKRVVAAELTDKDIIIKKRPVNMMSVVTALAGRKKVFLETDGEEVRIAVNKLLDFFDNKPVFVEDIFEADTIVVVSYEDASIIDVGDYLRDFSIRERRILKSKIVDIERALRE